MFASDVINGRIRLIVVVAVALGALVTGCSDGPTTATTSRHVGQTMMQRPGFGHMMGGVPHGYRLSPLTCSPPSSLPGTSVYVMLGDMGMARMMAGAAPFGSHMMLRAVPFAVPAGRVSFVVGNMGWRTHEMVVLPLAPRQSAGQRVPGSGGRVDERGSLGEASASCTAGSGEGIRPGAVGWVTLDLPAGRYELVCNLRNHYADGMHQLFVVT